MRVQSYLNREMKVGCSSTSECSCQLCVETYSGDVIYRVSKLAGKKRGVARATLKSLPPNPSSLTHLSVSLIQLN